MKRRIFNAIAVVSAMLCVAMVVLWVRSYSIYDGIHIGKGHHHVRGLSIEGVLEVSAWKYPDESALDCSAAHLSPEKQIGSFLRTAFSERKKSGYFGFFLVREPAILGCAGPSWFVCLLLTLLPAYSVRRKLVNRRHTLVGICATCCYDLRATPDRCPECGTVPKKEAAAS